MLTFPAWMQRSVAGEVPVQIFLPEVPWRRADLVNMRPGPVRRRCGEGTIESR